MKYYVDDIRTLGREVVEVEAKTPLEAARKAFPDCKVTRDYSGTGDIVVGRYTELRYSRGYRTFVYKLEV